MSKWSFHKEQSTQTNKSLLFSAQLTVIIQIAIELNVHLNFSEYFYSSISVANEIVH